MLGYTHIIQLDAEKRRVLIYREFETGRREIYTGVDMFSGDGSPKNYDELVRDVGETILIDMPEVRKIYGY